ncbi:YceI family protein [Henriciella sp.]|uniref:YceI family protein n=1 Tax=Henriciella sp. TaxID=1968823 RepID=UPI002602E8D6|nr:YceI family protein [Henriciella sp.]
MKLKTFLIGAASAFVITACAPAEDAPATDAETPPADGEATGEMDADGAMGGDAAGSESERAEKLQGAAEATYSLEPNHAFLSFTVMHNGLSEYTVDFTEFDATIDFNPQEPASSSIEATINPMALNVAYPGDYKEGHPDSEFESWPEALSKDARFLNAGEYPEITFVSTSSERTGDYTGSVTGDLTFLDQTKPVTLDVTYNGVANLPWYGERDLIGFDATGTISRSEFGQESLEGMISDEVTIEFSGEFLQDEPAALEGADDETETSTDSNDAANGDEDITEEN